MTIIKNIKTVKSYIKMINRNFNFGSTIGFVPTMGALHDGHLSLIEKAKEECDIVILSIFVNPTQFLPNEDLSKYPRTLEADLAKAKEMGVDMVFTPDIKDMYICEDEIKVLAPKSLSYKLEGLNRPKHFDGVVQIVLKLFNLIQPHKAYFGKKDAQQLAIITQMVNDLFLDIEIVACETIRENDGLAKSSRNVYLNKTQRELSLAISETLFKVKSMVSQGTFKVKTIKEECAYLLEFLDVEYFEIVDKEFNAIEKVEQNNSLALIAVKLDNIRLIDNIEI
jgi:pantoate--beta-alanine ligase